MKEYKSKNGTVVTIQGDELTCVSKGGLNLTLSNITVNYIDDVRFIAKNEMYEFYTVVEKGVLKHFYIGEL